MKARPQDDPELVRREYADESRFLARFSIWANREPNPPDVAFEEVVALRPRRVLEVGCGTGGFAARLVDARIDVLAVDQSERMVELTRSLGVQAQVGDVQDLPFADASFDVAVANFMLYHVPDLERGLAELARVAPALVATTNGREHMAEMWQLVGRDRWTETADLFMVENGAVYLSHHFDSVRTIDLPVTIEMTAGDMRRYVGNSVAHRHLAERVPEFEGTREVTASTAVFVASRAA
jgi:ubiquinone/menaquinone biosynthesis C-methylase UbiE